MPLDTRAETAGPVVPQPPEGNAHDYLSNIINSLRASVANTHVLPFPSVINPTLGDISPISGESQPNPEFYGRGAYPANTYEQPVSGGLGRVLTSPLAQKLQPRFDQIDNPLFALGPAGDFAGPLEPALLGAATQAKSLLRGAGQLVGGRLPNFATEAGGMARYDLGATSFLGEDGGGVSGGLSSRIGASGNLGKGEAFSDEATTAAQDAVASQRQMLIDRQIAELRARGASDAQVTDFMRTMAPSPAPRGSITSATGATVSAGKVTRAIQTALGHGEGAGMPEVLKAFAPGGEKFAGEGRKHGGVIGAATRAVMANDPEVTAALGPALTQQLQQGKVAQLARASGVDDTVIRNALQIMDSAAKTVAPEAKSAVADAVATKTALSAEAEATVFAAEHKALTDAGLAATDEAMQAMRDRLVAEARRATQTALKSTANTAGFINTLRASGRTDDELVAQLREMGLTAEEALRTLDLHPAPFEQPTIPPRNLPFGTPGTTDLGPAWAEKTEPTTIEAGQMMLPTEVGNGLPPSVPPAPLAPPARPPEPPIAQRGAEMFSKSIGGFLDALKQSAASLDISQLFRQGLIPIMSSAISRNPQSRIVARDAFVNAIKGYSDRYAGRIWSEVMADPMYQKWKASGGAERVIPAKSLEYAQSGATRSELFTGPLSNVGPIRASDRSFSLTLNALNFYRWKQGIEGIRAGGRIATKAEMDALANWYNVASGSGKLGQNPILNRIFWAPRFVISRVQTPYYAAKYLADPATREAGKIAAADLAKTIVGGLTMLEAAQLAGFKVGWDWTSTDFGKIQVGDTTLDIWGGFQQPAVLAARLVFDTYTSSSGVKSSLSQGGFTGTSVSDLLSRFQESKYGVGPGLLIAFASGKDFSGQPFGPRGGQSAEETALALASGHATPMSWGDVIDAVRADLKNGTSTARGLPPGSLGLVAGSASLLGPGASTYERTKAYDGLGRDLTGPLPDEPVLDAWKAVRDGSKKNDKGAPTFSDLTAPDDKIGSGDKAIALTPDEHDSLAKMVGEARKAFIGQVIADPKWATLGQGDKQDALAAAKTKADQFATAQFGIQMAKTAVDDTARTRAARVALSAAGGDTGRTMDTLTSLGTQGSLTPGTKAAIDATREYTDPYGKNYELSVDEYLRGGALVRQFLATPAFRIGTPQTALAAAHEASLLRAAYIAMQREATARGIQIYQVGAYKTYLAQRNTIKVDGFPIQRFVDLDGTINEAAVSPQRLALAQDPLWSRFRAVAEKRDPYSPH